MTSTRNPASRLLTTATLAALVGTLFVGAAPTAAADPCNGVHWDDSSSHLCVGESDNCTGYEYDSENTWSSRYEYTRVEDYNCTGFHDDCTGSGSTHYEEHWVYTPKYWYYYDYSSESCAGVSDDCAGYWFRDDNGTQCIGYYDGPADWIQLLA